MALLPKRVKYRKVQRGSRKGNATKGNVISFGDYAIQALERGWISNVEIEAARVAMNRNMKRGGKVWIRIFPAKPITKKPLETRMGKGKGAPEGWVGVVKPGRILFEIEGVNENLAKESMALAAAKLSMRTRFITRD